jgi:hypothetical protein
MKGLLGGIFDRREQLCYRLFVGPREGREARCGSGGREEGCEELGHTFVLRGLRILEEGSEDERRLRGREARGAASTHNRFEISMKDEIS